MEKNTEMVWSIADNCYVSREWWNEIERERKAVVRAQRERAAIERAGLAALLTKGN